MSDRLSIHRITDVEIEAERVNLPSRKESPGCRYYCVTIKLTKGNGSITRVLLYPEGTLTEQKRVVDVLRGKK